MQSWHRLVSTKLDFAKNTLQLAMQKIYNESPHIIIRFVTIITLLTGEA